MAELSIAVAISLATLTVLGLPIALALGLRGLWAAALTPVFATSAIVTAALVAPIVGIGWSILPAAAVALLGALILWPLRVLTTRNRETVESTVAKISPWWAVIALAIAAVVIATQILLIIGAPDHFSQTYDNIFHLNATRYILSEHNASPYFVGTVADYSGKQVFYPSGWHALVSLVCQLSGATIPTVVNAVTIAVAAVIWPLGAMVLTRALFGASPALTITTGLVATAIPGFPLLLLDYGVLYPLQFGLAMLPAALAMALAMFGLSRDDVNLPPGWRFIAAFGCLPALAIAHPGALVAWLAFSLPMAVAAVPTLWRKKRSVVTLLISLLALAAYIFMVLRLVDVLRPPAETRTWQIDRRMREAVVDIVTVDFWYWAPAYLIGAAAIAGIIFGLVKFTGASFAAIGMWAIGALLFFYVTSAPWQDARDFLTGPWYNNIPRVAAILSIAIMPLAAYGFAQAWESLTRGWQKRQATAPTGHIIVGGVATVLLLAILQVSVMPKVIPMASQSFEITDDSALLTPDELALLDRIPQHVPEGARIAGSPWTGTSLAYALEDREVLAAHTAVTFDEDGQAIVDRLNEAAQDPGTLCPALAEYNVEYFLDFGDREVHGDDNSWRYPGFAELESSQAVKLIDEQGDDVKLYKIVACPTTAG